MADKRFIEQLIPHIFGVPIADNCVIQTEGYNNLMAEGKEIAYVNQMKMNTDNGGVNLVIFDADEDCEARRAEILDWQRRNGVDFELFLFPDNRTCGAIEDLLEKIINPENKVVMDCWEQYENSISGIRLAWKKGQALTIPAKKTKIYAYLEVLLGCSKSEKEKIKEKNRDYTNANHWNLNAAALTNLTTFLKKHLQ